MVFLVGFLKWLVLSSVALFAAAAVFFCARLRGEIRFALAVAVMLGILGPFFFLDHWSEQLIGAVPVLILVFGWYSSMKPKQDAPWLKEYAVLPRVDVQGDSLTVRGIRNFQYRSITDFDVQYYDKVYDLKELSTVDLFLSYWGTTAIAHSIMSFGFTNGDHLAVSIETRREIGEAYSAVKGFFKIFELIYVIADERDCIGLRVNARNEDVYLYRLKSSLAETKTLLLDYMRKVKQLEDTPDFYNALLTNCTTSIIPHLRAVRPEFKLHSAVLANGYIDKWRYDTGVWGFEIPFEEFRRRSHINAKVKEAIDSPDFSARIRAGLPSICSKATI